MFGVQFTPLVSEVLNNDTDELQAIQGRLESHHYLRGRLYTADHRQTWVRVELEKFPNIENKMGGEDPVMLVGSSVQKVLENYQTANFQAIATGIPIVTYEQQTYFLSEATRIVIFALLVALIITYLLIHSIKDVIYILLTGIVAIIVAFGLFGLTGIIVDTTLMTLPVCLALATAIGYNIHIYNYVNLDVTRSSAANERIYYALKHSGRPLFFTALTSILALLSFNFIQIHPVRWVGNASALVILLVFVISVVIMPALRTYKTYPKHSKTVFFSHKINALMAFLAGRVIRHKRWVIWITIGLILVSMAGLSRIEVDLNSLRVIGTRIPYMQRFQEISESEIATLYSYDLIVELDDDIISNPEIMCHTFQELETFTKTLSLTKNTRSALDHLRVANWVSHHKNPKYYAVPDELSQQRRLLKLLSLSDQENIRSWVDFDSGMMRLQVGVDEYDPDRVLGEIDQLKHYAQDLFPQARISLVGTFVQFSMIQQYIVHGQLQSLLFALLAICVTLIIIFRSIQVGLIAMIPNVAPVLVIGGVLGWFKLPLDSITMTVMPMIFGIAVDDSIHFVDYLRRSIKGDSDYDSAIRSTYVNIGPALLKTTLILVFTFSVYFISLANFFNLLALLVIVGLLAALLADFTLTPLLIRYFKPFK